jgi:hypothetical protein
MIARTYRHEHAPAGESDQLELAASVTIARARRRRQPVMVETLQQPADHRLGWPAPGIDTQQTCRMFGQVSNPFSDRGVRTAAGHDRAYRRGDHHRQSMPHAAASPWIGHVRQRFGQPCHRSGKQAPAGAADNTEISDDGNAGMAHFGETNKA